MTREQRLVELLSEARPFFEGCDLRKRIDAALAEPAPRAEQNADDPLCVQQGLYTKVEHDSWRLVELLRRWLERIEPGFILPDYQQRLVDDTLAALAEPQNAAPQRPTLSGIQDTSDTEGRAGSALPKDGHKQNAAASQVKQGVNRDRQTCVDAPGPAIAAASATDSERPPATTPEELSKRLDEISAEGAAQNVAGQELPASTVSAASVSPVSGILGSEASEVKQPVPAAPEEAPSEAVKLAHRILANESKPDHWAEVQLADELLRLTKESEDLMKANTALTTIGQLAIAEAEQAKAHIGTLEANPQRDVSVPDLPCGHPAALLVKSVESDYQYCDLCECRKRRNDAEEMERTHLAKLNKGNENAARYLFLRSDQHTFAVFMPRQHGHIAFMEEGLDEKIDEAMRKRTDIQHSPEGKV